MHECGEERLILNRCPLRYRFWTWLLSSVSSHCGQQAAPCSGTRLSEPHVCDMCTRRRARRRTRRFILSGKICRDFSLFIRGIRLVSQTQGQHNGACSVGRHSACWEITLKVTALFSLLQLNMSFNRENNAQDWSSTRGQRILEAMQMSWIASFCSFFCFIVAFKISQMISDFRRLLYRQQTLAWCINSAGNGL